MILTPPLHIDFVITFQNKHKTTGYWFITWINGASRIEVWRKLEKSGGWCLAAGTVDDMNLEIGMSPDNSPVIKRKDVEYFTTGIIRAKPEKANELDRILFDYMNANGFPYASPYKYWPNPHENHPDETYC